eukprot:3354902-Alexandrium_andersonii.AAC.1
MCSSSSRATWRRPRCLNSGVSWTSRRPGGSSTSGVMGACWDTQVPRAGTDICPGHDRQACPAPVRPTTHA